MAFEELAAQSQFTGGVLVVDAMASRTDIPISPFEGFLCPLPAAAKEHGHALGANAGFSDFTTCLVRIVSVLLDMMGFHHVVTWLSAMDISLLHGSSL
jgi:hypothetical protein